MKRTLVNLIIDFAAALLFLAMIATGYLLRFPLPPGTNKALSLWGLTRHQWGEIHFWISLGLLSVLVVHFILHWQWLVTVIRQRVHRPKNESSHVGWITTLVIVGVFVVFAWAADLSVHERADPCCEAAAKNDAKHLENPTAPQELAPKAPSSSPVSWKDVYPLLVRSCLSCHDPKKAKGNFRVDRKEDFLTPRDGKAWVIPGNPDESPLMRKTLDRGRRVREVLKQPQYEPLPVAEQIAVLHAVSEGLLDSVPLDQVEEGERAIRLGVVRLLPALCEHMSEGHKLGPEDREALLGMARRAIHSLPGAANANA